MTDNVLDDLQRIVNEAVNSVNENSIWEEPQPLSLRIAPEPYPTEALPKTIRDAVLEVTDFVKAPVAMVAGSAIGALSLAAQAHFNVQRAKRLEGPISIFAMTIADSGERKSTCDNFFTSAIREYEDEQSNALKPDQHKYEADISAWQAEHDGIVLAIKGITRGNSKKETRSIDFLKASLQELESRKPEPPKIPRYLLGDETPENLAWGLAKKWPSSGIVSAEAGVVFGAHGMSTDSVMRNLGLLNILWDGGTHSVGRRTSESFTVKDARLTVALQIQEMTLRSFFKQSGGLARGTGFLARFLISWPESTQGTRNFTEAPEHWPNLAQFHQRIERILKMPLPISEEGILTPSLMTLSPSAKDAWIKYHDAIEKQLSYSGELFDIRDVASKSADNAVRLAALFQSFENGICNLIEEEYFQCASTIAAWHLYEAKRFFGEIALPVEQVNLSRLDAWLIEYCRRNGVIQILKNYVRQYGPLRDKSTLDSALKELENLDRVRLITINKSIILQINPSLLVQS